jgi:hypothetical protein
MACQLIEILVTEDLFQTQAEQVFVLVGGSLPGPDIREIIVFHERGQGGHGWFVLLVLSRVFVLVDNDHEGRTLYKNGKLDVGAKWVQHNSNGTYWCRLPWTEEFKTVMKRLEVTKTAWPGCIENLFGADVRNEARNRRPTA